MARTRSGGQSLITIETSESERDPSKKSDKKKKKKKKVKELFCIGNSFSFILFSSLFQIRSKQERLCESNLPLVLVVH